MGVLPAKRGSNHWVFLRTQVPFLENLLLTYASVKRSLGDREVA